MTQADIDRNEIIWQNEVLEMARQAWVDSGEGWVAYGWFSDRVNALGAFAKLVAAKEREKFLRLSTKAKDVDENCDIVLAADIRGDKA